MKAYSEILTMLKESGDNKLYVAVIYSTGRHEWLPVDKAEYIRQLSLISNADAVPYPCHVEVEKDGEMFIHPRWENL